MSLARCTSCKEIMSHLDFDQHTCTTNNNGDKTMEDTQIQYYDELINGVRDGMSKRFYIKTTSMTLEITAEQAVTVLEEYIESRYQRLDEFGDDGCEHELWVEPNDRGKLVLILIQPTNQG